MLWWVVAWLCVSLSCCISGRSCVGPVVNWLVVVVLPHRSSWSWSHGHHGLCGDVAAVCPLGVPVR